MDIQLKQRLIGVIVFFTLLIIFLPMVLDNDGGQKYVEQVLQPPLPDVIKQSSVLPTEELINDGNKDNHINGIEVDSDELDQVITTKNNLAEPINPVENDLNKITLKQLETKSNTKFNNKSDTESVSDSVSIAKVTNNKPSKPINNKTTVKDSKETKTSKNKQSTGSLVASQQAIASQHLSTKSVNSAIIYNITNKRENNEVFAVKVGAFNSSAAAKKEKTKLQAMGLPAYINKDASKYNLYVGPELEFKYIKELAKRVQNETDYTAEVLIHDARWAVE